MKARRRRRRRRRGEEQGLDKHWSIVNGGSGWKESKSLPVRKGRKGSKRVELEQLLSKVVISIKILIDGQARQGNTPIS